MSATDHQTFSHDAPGEPPRGRRLALLALTALGVVYGDIGTSPLYAIRECFNGPHGLAATPENILGVLSLVFWALVIVISIKYLLYIMRADNRGEGGELALMALLLPRLPPGAKKVLLVSLGVFGASLLYGDGMITPAISVLSAIEGLEVATPVFSPYVVPITLVILILLFAFQKRGTARIGVVFGPVTLVWFLILGVLGIGGILRHPAILAALNPYWAVRIFLDNRWAGFLVLGAVFLVVTGGEALYTDMGHFGRRPIRLAWFVIVLPCLLINYFGQGALLTVDPAAVVSPFYLLAPRWFLYPLVAIATCATIIASQAVVSGAFSMTRQAVLLGFCPRLRITHTSSREIGQIYIPWVNWVLMITTVLVVLGFRTSSNLAAAYGVAVSTTMVITTILAFFVTRWVWHWPLALSLLVTGAFLAMDVSFFTANILKIGEGGWFPLLIGALVFTLLSTWRRGRTILAQQLRDEQLSMDLFLDDVRRRQPTRVSGLAVFMTGSSEGTPRALLHHFKHNKVLHEKILFLTITNLEIPFVPDGERLSVEELGSGFFRVIGRYGFKETPDVPRLLEQARTFDLEVKMDSTSFFLGRETLIPVPHQGMPVWRKALFSFMSRNALPATAFFGIPPGRVIELGLQVRL